MEIGKRIIDLREKKGWTTNRLANACGLSQSFLRAVELEEKGISVESLSLVCDARGVSLRDFFDLPGEEETPEARLERRVRELTPRQKGSLLQFLDAMAGEGRAPR